MSSELDPQFLKALTLLHSSDPNATDVLKQMLITAMKNENIKPPKESPPSVKVGGMEKDVYVPVKTEKCESEEPWEPAALKDEDEMAFEIMESLVCVKCRGLDVAPGNQLVECQECHCLYHQKCHIPPVNDEEVYDPRLLWHCCKCQQDVETKNTKTVPATPASNFWGGTAAKSSKANSSNTTTKNSHSFKNLTAKSGSPSKTTPLQLSTSLLNADKRLQIMKRKAAAKMHEKRMLK